MEATGGKPRLLVADDAPTRLGVRMALEGVATVCAEADSAEQAIAAAAAHRPEVCFVGSGVAGGGAAAVRGISAELPDAALVILASSPDPDLLLACVRAGAIGYLPKSIDPEGLRRALGAVLAGQAAVPRSMVRALVRELRALTGSGVGLTSREAQVLAMLSRGHRTARIADRLGVSPVTVRRHVSEIMRKRGATSRSRLSGGS
jgi:DNA-binding NarL/FixJ family response regulator